VGVAGISTTGYSGFFGPTLLPGPPHATNRGAIIFNNSDYRHPQLTLHEDSAAASYARINFTNVETNYDSELKPIGDMWSIRAIPRNNYSGAKMSIQYWNGPVGKDLFNVTGGGSVGIGTTSPQQKFQITDSSPQCYIRLTTSTNTKGSFFGAYNDKTIFQNQDDGSMQWFTGGALNMYLTAGGNLYTPNGSVSSLDMASTSSLRYKENIQPLQDDFQKVLLLEPKTFNWKVNGKAGLGYIAEEVEGAGLKSLVVYNESGQPDALNYDKISIYLLEVIKDQNSRIKALEAKVGALEAK
jgi:hypothetical protein